MSNNVNVTLTGSSSDAQQAWLEVIGMVREFKREVESARRKLRETGGSGSTEMKKVADETKRAADMFKRFATVGAYLAVAQKTFAFIRQDLQKISDLNQKIAGSKTEFALEMKQIGLVLPSDTDVQYGDLEKLVMRKGGTTAPVERARMLKAAISAGQNMPVSERAEIWEAILDMFPGATAEDIQPLLGAIVNMKRLYGGTYRENAATTFQALSESRVEEVAQFANNIVGAVQSAGSGFGISQKQAFSYLSAISSQANDVEGQVTGTNFIKWVRQLDEEFKARGVTFEGEYPGDQMLDRIRDANDPISKAIRIKMLGASNPDAEESKLARAMGIGQGSIRTREKTFVPLMQMTAKEGTYSTLPGESNALAFLESSRRNIKVGEEAEVFMRERMQQIDSSLLQVATAVENIANAVNEQAEGSTASNRRAVLGSIGKLQDSIVKINADQFGDMTIYGAMQSLGNALMGNSNIEDALRSAIERVNFSLESRRTEFELDEARGKVVPLDVQQDRELAISAMEEAVKGLTIVLERFAELESKPKVVRLEEQEAPARPGGQ